MNIQKFLVITVIVATSLWADCVIAQTSNPGEFDGVWRTRGYGAVISIDGNQIEIYEETEASFFSLGNVTLEGNRVNMGWEPDEEVYSLSIDEGLLVAEHRTSRLEFDRLDQLPRISGTSPDPATVFDVFWQTIEENFASFSLLGLDWNEVRARFEPSINPGMSDTALFNLLAQMGAELLDPNTELEDPINGRYRTLGPEPGLLAGPLRDDVLRNVQDSYIDGGALTPTYLDDRFLFGTIDAGRIGYLAIIDYDWRPLDFGQSLDTALSMVADTQALIIDLRRIDGGEDWHALTLTDRVADREREVLTRVVRNGGPDDFVSPTPFVTRPAGESISEKPVYILTNEGTRGVGDVQTLMLNSLPNVTQVGEATAGSFSQFSHLLPNGWVLFTSNERYLSNEGLNYEYLGIQPELEVINTVEALNAGQDLVLEAAIEHHDSRLPMTTGSRVVSGAMSGNWYAPDHDGEGFVLEVLDDQQAVAYWFTYAPEQGRQVWMMSVGEIEGDEIRFAEMLQPSGAKFGDAFDPDDVYMPVWGDVSIRFTDCDRAIVSYSGSDSFGANFLSVQRLSGVHGVDCDGPDSSAINSISGSWFDPDRTGEGWTLAQVDDDSVAGLWFTYNTDGQPLWLIGVGDLDGNSVEFNELLKFSGGRFGPAFDPADVNSEVWGRANFTVVSCDIVEVEWQSELEGYDSGGQVLSRLTQPQGLVCDL